MGSKSRESIFGPSIRASAERAAAARKEADRLACEAWLPQLQLRGFVLRFRNQRLIKRRRAMTLTGILLALGCVIAVLLFALLLWWWFGR